MEWISVKNVLPRVDKRVLVSFIGYSDKPYQTIAFYVPVKTKPDESDYEGDCEYDEETDKYYWPEGWYEFQYEADVNYHIEKEVTHWMPLPEPPKL